MIQKAIYSVGDPERKRQIRQIFMGLIPLLAVFLALVIVLSSSSDLPPFLWRTKEITLVEIQKKTGIFGSRNSGRRPWSGSTGSGRESVYVIEDQDGVHYRVDASQLTTGDGGSVWPALREGTTCTVVYSPRLGLRQVKGLVRGGMAHLDPSDQARLWYLYSPFYVVLLLALAGSVCAIIHHIRRGLENLRIVEYQAQIRAEQGKNPPVPSDTAGQGCSPEAAYTRGQSAAFLYRRRG